MAAVRPNSPPPDGTPRLAARLKFERYVFIAFFAAMTMLAVGMLVEYHRQQDELLSARQEGEDLNLALRQSRQRNDSDRARHDQTLGELRAALAESGERESRRSRDLGLALLQLALDEAQAGAAGRARGRALLEEAERYGAGPYAPLARWALLDASSPLAPPVEKAAFFAAAVSQNGALLAVARAAHIEIFNLREGRLQALIAHPAQAGQPSALALSAECLVAGYASGLLAVCRLATPANWQTARQAAGVRLAQLSPSGARLALLDELGTLRLLDTARPDSPLIEVRLDERVRAFAPLDDAARPLLAVTADGSLWEIRSPTEHRQTRLAPSPLRRAACLVLGALVFVAAEGNEGLAILECGEGSSVKRHALEGPWASVAGIQFFPDGTLCLADSLGRIYEYDPRGHALASYRLGADEAPVFVARAGVFTLGLTADGAFSCRFEPELHRRGQYVARHPQEATATSQGFACEALGVWPAALRSWIATTALTQAQPAGRHACGVRGAEVSVGASRFNASGRLLCAFASGAALLKPAGRRLLLLSPGGQQHELALPAGVEPDAAWAAAEAEVALLNCGGSLYLAQVREGRLQDLKRSTRGPAAIDARGAVVASTTLNEIVVARAQPPALELHISLDAPPRFVGLMFGGSLLAVLEADGVLAFFDAASGRRLLSVEPASPQRDFLSVACSDQELFFVHEQALRVLSLR
ncbi:hypothetical protein EDM80_10500 [bacterium]|nr:MAG: hypothetical protein EDM80_10500 [bacterium]RIK64069.1 MAG: hypothetical protein DCC64_04985 [Planctomycetota bacterium]